MKAIFNSSLSGKTSVIGNLLRVLSFLSLLLYIASGCVRASRDSKSSSITNKDADWGAELAAIKTVDGLQINPKDPFERRPNIPIQQQRREREPKVEELKLVIPLLEAFLAFAKPLVEQHGIPFSMRVQYYALAEGEACENLCSKSSPTPESKRKTEIIMDEFALTGFVGGNVNKPQMGKDLLTKALCHELGHIISGYPTISFNGQTLSVEGQADYFAASVCLKSLWNSQTAANEQVSRQVAPSVTKRCEKLASSNAKNLCARIIQSELDYWTWKGIASVSVEASDRTVVEETLVYYPADQCRLDTAIAGALCEAPFDLKTIPSSKEQALANSCHEANNPTGARPRCWFKE